MHSLQNIVDYAAHHDYYLVLSGQADPNSAAAWNKVKAWEAPLHSYDWVWQTDQDMLIMNFNQRLESFIDDRYDIIIGRDCYGWETVLRSDMSELDAARLGINSGSFFMKSSAWTRNFVQQVWEANGSDIREALGVGWYDQAAMMQVIANDPSAGDHIKVVPGRDFNAWPRSRQTIIDLVTPTTCDYLQSVFYQPGDFAIHFVSGSESGNSSWDKADLVSYVGKE